ncbi:MAG: pirin family protein [Isosphaeraceae bacterium]
MTPTPFGLIEVVYVMANLASLDVGTVVSMREHQNDEILSCMWRGAMVHEDSEGHRVPVSPGGLTMINAGKSFWHEELTPGVPVEMLQILIRPHKADLPGEARFYDPPSRLPESQWRLIAGPEASDALLKIRQLVIVSDAQLMEGGAASVPAAEGMTSLLYVMDGAIRVGDARLGKGDTVTDLDGTWPVVHAESAATLVAFVVVRSAPASTAGTIRRR